MRGQGLSERELKRYGKQLPLFSIEGQRILKNSKVLIIGAGGLGSPASLYLAAAGVGHLGIIDSDRVEISNLQRQILHSTEDIGKEKTFSAKKRLLALNPEIHVTTYTMRLSKENVEDMIEEYHLIVDGVDNFPSRYLVNDACVFHSKPLIEAGILQFDGQVMGIWPWKGPCYRCLFPYPPPPGSVPSCQEAGVLGAVAGIIGTIQAAEAIKYLLGMGQLLVGRILIFNALAMLFRTIPIQRNPQCPLCGENPSITELREEEFVCELDNGI